MLELIDIRKDYQIAGGAVHALKGVSIKFRKNEFVSILGASGCGKTTLLNIIGGLDKYTSGDLIIEGTSTKQYKDGDWDTYRNHSIGFIFQSYHLIPHQTILQNVELALTIAGVSKEERRRRAAEALEKVGLGDKINTRRTGATRCHRPRVDKRPRNSFGGRTYRRVGQQNKRANYEFAERNFKRQTRNYGHAQPRTCRRIFHAYYPPSGRRNSGRQYAV